TGTLPTMARSSLSSRGSEMTFKILIEEEVTQRPNGDRDPNRHPCSKFTVSVVRGTEMTTIAVHDQWDPHWTSISGTRSGHLKKAQETVEKWSSILDAPVEGPERPVLQHPKRLTLSGVRSKEGNLDVLSILDEATGNA